MSETSAGYSGTPLPKKFGIREHTLFAAPGAPDGFDETLGELPTGARHARDGESPTIIVAFHTEREALIASWTGLTDTVGPLGTVWVAWPKKASKVPTDITETTLRADLLPTGWVDVKVCAIDARWSGLKFVLRKELR